MKFFNWLWRNKVSVVFYSGFGLAVVLIYFQDPASPSSILPPCPFHWVTGLHCPGCGSSRALHELMHGNIMAAIDLQPLFVIMIPLLTVYGVLKLVYYRKNRGLVPVFSHPAFMWSLVILVLIYWILRNLPFEPFTWLAP